ncbi:MULTISPECIES: hypothetical protein [Paenibacillus]|uniref:DUF2642 domain-containing protein n=1 Tax=Paenibacillus vini TaxID=1476024 RepID=A0ABQ4MAT1_9BACL|nr:MULTISPECIES: hypothetical protein [Paenibacillus]MBQ4898591.1 hypothetical protein [Paenibacillus sp. Marseille-P2973]GIP53104.1 hypothetical protein J42TS3_21390 [Paenibacillus vini]
MRALQFLLNTPLRTRIRTLQARIELLENRIDHLESSIEASKFPDAETYEKLAKSEGRFLTVIAGESLIQGTLVSIQTESLELIDDSGQVVMIPFPRITAVRF